MPASAETNIATEAARLIQLEDDTVYDTELVLWLAPERRARVAELIVAALTAPGRANKRPPRAWPIDLVSYVPVDALPTVARAARVFAKSTNATPAGPVVIDWDDPAAMKRGLDAMMGGDRLPEDLIASTKLQLPAKEPAVRSKASSRAPAPLGPPHHLALTLEHRMRTAVDAATRFARAHHPTWELEDTVGSTAIRLGGARIESASRGCIALVRIVDVGALVPGSTFGPLELDLPMDVVVENDGANVFLDELGRTKTVRLQSGRNAGTEDDRALVACEARLVPTPPRFVRQNWGISNRRENLNRFLGTPTFVQGDRYPKCPTCKTPQPFLAQFELGLPFEDGFDLFDSGVAYAFLCAPCRVVTWSYQMT